MLKIAFSGEENTGKTTLSSWLAKKEGLIYFPEFARQLLDERSKMDVVDWNLWVLELYKSTYSILKNNGFVADRPISDVYAYLSSIVDNPKISFDSLRYQYDVLIVLERKLDRPQWKNHVKWSKDQEVKIAESLKIYEYILARRGTKVLRIDSDDIDEKKGLITEFLERVRGEYYAER